MQYISEDCLKAEWMNYDEQLHNLKIEKMTEKPKWNILYKVFQNTPQYISVEFVAVEFQTAVQNSKNVNASQH